MPANNATKMAMAMMAMPAVSAPLIPEELWAEAEAAAPDAVGVAVSEVELLVETYVEVCRVLGATRRLVCDLANVVLGSVMTEASAVLVIEEELAVMGSTFSVVYPAVGPAKVGDSVT